MKRTFWTVEGFVNGAHCWMEYTFEDYNTAKNFMLTIWQQISQ